MYDWINVEEHRCRLAKESQGLEKKTEMLPEDKFILGEIVIVNCADLPKQHQCCY
jgi:hypothetical protein